MSGTFSRTGPAGRDGDTTHFYRGDGTWAVPASGGGNPAGTLIMWLTDTAPDGYLLCYGQAVSSATYAALYAVIGITFGGDGAPNFNLPDMRGRIPLGQDDMGGASANRVTSVQADSIGGASGAETHALSEAELATHLHACDPPNTTSNNQSASHNHTDSGHAHVEQYWDPNASIPVSYGGAYQAGQPSLYGPGMTTAATRLTISTQIGTATIGNQSASHTHAVDIASFNSGNTGSSTAHNNMSPYITVNYAIKI